MSKYNVGLVQYIDLVHYIEAILDINNIEGNCDKIEYWNA